MPRGLADGSPLFGLAGRDSGAPKGHKLRAEREVPLGPVIASLELILQEGQLGLDPKLKCKLPRRGSGTGAYG